MNEGGAALSLTYIAAEDVIPGYGGGMSSAKAALESDTRTLAWEAGRKYGIRVNTISAGPLKSRAASAISERGKKSFIDLAIDYSKANSPLGKDLYADDVGSSAYYLLSPLARAVTGVTLYVDNGLHAMGMAVDSNALTADGEGRACRAAGLDVFQGRPRSRSVRGSQGVRGSRRRRGRLAASMLFVRSNPPSAGHRHRVRSLTSRAHAGLPVPEKA